MNALFERFIREAIRETLSIEPRAFPAAAAGHAARRGTGCAAEARSVVVVRQPLPLRRDGEYKRTEGTVPNADVCPAYLTALKLTDGLLIYAAGEDVPHTVTVAAAGKRIHVRTVDVTQAPMEVLSQVKVLRDSFDRLRSAHLGP